MANVPPGTQVLQARQLGLALAGIPVTLAGSGTLAIELSMAAVVLRMTEVHVTADANSRARGELGSASVMTREVIANQGAASLAGQGAVT